MNERSHEPYILGYADRLSARAGDTIAFKVSSNSNTPFNARLTRSISADPNPAGAGIVEEDASSYFDASSFPSVQRPFHPGSYAIATSDVAATAGSVLQLTARIYPTLVNGKTQSIISVGSIDLHLDGSGSLGLTVDDQNVTATHTLKPRRWYLVTVRIHGLHVTLKHQQLGSAQSSPLVTQGALEQYATLSGKPIIAARSINGVISRHFNGKIEAPSIETDEQIICAWDFSLGISTTSVVASTGPDLELINFPARAVTGACWDGSEMNWTHKPDHYAAIHFHDDDIYDFGWDTDFTFTVPSGMPSGAYVMHLDCDNHQDAIPFFICAEAGKRTAQLCVLVSTFTYAIYGNHARPDYEPSWQNRIREWDAYPHNPAEHQEYGLSTYNYHSDGSGICHASHRRPLFNLRPGYLTFGNTPCSGLRHFQADSHLLSWLHAKGITYDLVTDRELHDEGLAAIEGYKAVTTASHPEYHTAETLDALQGYRDTGGNLMYLGGNGFYWRVAIHNDNASLLEIRRAEDGIRAWAAEPGEYYNAFDGTYGGLWRRNGRPPQDLVGIGFAAQGEFFGDPYRRVCRDEHFDWLFDGIEEEIIGDFGFSGNGAAGFELDHIDQRLGTPENTVLLARSVTRDNGFMLVPEEQLTHLTNLSGGTEKDALHADMIWTDYPGGGSVFATGSITFCGSLPWNDFDNNVSRLLMNVLNRHLEP